ncbi:MAG: FecR family protein, partial [Planctomycetota bacterium]
MTREELLLLLDEYHDGTITPADAQRLAGIIRTGGDDARTVMDDIRFSGYLAQALAPVADDEFARSFNERLAAEDDAQGFARSFETRPMDRKATRHRPRSARPARISWPAFAAIAALMVIAAALVFRFLAPGEPAAPALNAAVTRATAGVTVARAAARVTGTPGLALYRDDSLTTGPEAAARVEYRSESTHVEIGGDTVLAFREENGAKVIRLDRGSIRCSVAPQPASRPFRVITPYSTTVVVGTEFGVAVDTTGATTTVTQGTAKVTRASDGAAATVAAGQTVTAGATGPLAVKSLNAAPATPVGRRVSGIKVISGKVEDVSTMEAILGWMVQPGMTDEQKALAVWETVVKFRQQTDPPNDYLTQEGHPHDPVKMFNVFGYCFCGCAASQVTFSTASMTRKMSCAVSTLNPAPRTGSTPATAPANTRATTTARVTSTPSTTHMSSRSVRSATSPASAKKRTRRCGQRMSSTSTAQHSRTADFLIRAENGLAHFHVRQECKSAAFRSRDGGKTIRSVRAARRQLP